ncbi:MAG: hypothetical protein K6G85_07145 [Eubacterium sp.]|nr:hypothetical protein [Eubacterium sp.]
MKRFFLLICMLTLTLSLSACGGSDSKEEKKAETTTKKVEKETTTVKEKETINPKQAKLSYATVNAPDGWSIVETTINMARLQQDGGTADMKVWCSAFTSAEEFVDGDILGFKEKEKIELKKLQMEIGGRTYFGYHPNNEDIKFVLATDAKKGYVEVDGDGLTIDEAKAFIETIEVVDKEAKY